MKKYPPKLKKKHYDQKYSSSWEKEEDYVGWIEPSLKGNKYFHCKACKCDLKCGGGKFVISKHARSSKHLSNFPSQGKTNDQENSRYHHPPVEYLEEKDYSSSDESLSRKFEKSWLADPKFAKWIIEINDEKVKCKYCDCVIRAKLYNLLKHRKTSKHVAAVSPLNANNQDPLKSQSYSMPSLKPDLSKPTCRICLQNNNEEMSSIYDVEEDFNNRHIYEEIELCAGIKVLRHEKLPTLICSGCYEFLKVSRTFRWTCRNADDYLKQFVIVVKGNEEMEISLEEDALPIFEYTSTKPDRCSQYKTRLGENPSSQPQKVKNVNICPSSTSKNIKENLDDNVYDDLKEIFFDTNCQEYVDDNLGVSIDQIELNTNKEALDPSQFENHANKDKKNSIIMEKRSGTDPSKVSEMSSAGDAIMAEKKEKQSCICEVCGNTYRLRHSLKLHMRRHRGEKPYECELCTSAFHSSVELIRHMRKHTGSKPFKCGYCSRAFGDKSTLIKHERTHRNERPFKCEECGKSFSYANVLKYHKYIHTGEKPYTCELCGKDFALPHQLRAHLETLQHRSDPRSKILLQNIRKCKENEVVQIFIS